MEASPARIVKGATHKDTVKMKSKRIPILPIFTAMVFLAVLFLPGCFEYRIKHTPEMRLMYAIEAGDIEEVRTLLKQGVSPNTRGCPTHEKGIYFWYQRLNYSPEGGGYDHFGDWYTTLGVAGSNAPMVRLLMESGADANADEGNAVSSTANRAADTGDMEALQVYLGYRLPTTTLVAAMCGAMESNWEREALSSPGDGSKPKPFDATRSQQAQVIQLLLSRGVPLNGENAIGWFPLLAALQYSNFEVADFIVSKGANIDYQSRIDYQNRTEGKTALMNEAELGSAEGVQWLLKRKAKVNLRDKKGRTALYYARKNLPDSTLNPHHHFQEAYDAIKKAGGVE